MKVARYNYRAQLGSSAAGILRDIESMLLEGRYLLCREVTEFEAAFGAYIGMQHARTVSTGTDALTIALRALGVGPGDEVVTQANTFHATVAAIRLVGARPVLVDADAETFLMDLSALAAATSPRTRVIMPVHLFGKPTPMRTPLEVAARLGVPVVEDAAQAHGARIDDVRAGATGSISCFSFHPSKNLAAAGDGGAILTNDSELDEQVRRHRELGQVGQNHHVVVGYHSKLDAIQCRVLSSKLPQLDGWNEQRRAVARRYRKGLADLPVYFQAWDEGEDHVFHLFQLGSSGRDGLLAHLREQGVDAVVRYPTPIHLQPAFADLDWQRGQFPVAERLADELLCLPIRPDMTEEETEYVIDQVRAFFLEAAS